MRKIQVSLICTVKNEEETIGFLLDSIKHQTTKPDEVIIVDGGSTDKTIKIIEEFQKTGNLPIKLIVANGANIAQGRNIAIRNAKYNIIACTDGGCKLNPNWLQRIIEPFEKSDVDVVSGVYLPWCETEFEEIASYIVFPDIERLDPNKFLPSGRSIAFKREAWELVAGYPEWLDAAEDTLFDLKLRKQGMRFTLAKEAIAYWRVRKNIKEIFKQFYNYAKGDGLALLFPQLYLARYISAMALILLATMLWHDTKFWFVITPIILAILWYKYLKKVRRPSLRRLFTALLVALTIETGLAIGYLKGTLTRFFKLKTISQEE